MSSAKTGILFLGATGYIGGSVLHRFLQHPNASTFDITVLVRTAEKAKVFETKFGLKAVVGSTNDIELLEKLAEEAHIVFSVVKLDDLPAIQAVLRGLKNRHAGTGDVPLLIHTSGAGIVMTDDKGEFASEAQYDDLNIEQIESLPPNDPRRAVNLAIVEADQQGYLRSYIILPGLIYGIAHSPFVDAGVQNAHSIQIPAVIGAILARGEPGVVGKGLAIWPDVSIDDISDLFIVLYDKIATEVIEVAHGREGYYFGENGEFTWLELSQAIGDVLFEMGIIKSKEVTAFSKDDMIKCFGSEAIANFFGTNSRCKANRSRALGWKPKNTTADMLASIKPEILAITSQPDFFEKFMARFK